MATNTTTKQPKQNNNGNALLRLIPLSQLEPPPQNPRKKIDRAKLKELTESIKERGVLQPILVREKHPANGKLALYQIVAGERRYRAAEAAGLQEIPAQIKDLDETAALSAQLIENIQREDVHPLDEAAGFLRLQTEMNLSLKEIAQRLGKDARYVARRFALTNLIAEAQQDFRQERIALGHALEICRLAPQIQRYALNACYETRFVMTAEEEREEVVDKMRPAHPVHYLVEWLARNVHFNLTNAPFALDDPRLREDALTCLHCPNRSGFNKTLFADIQERDICLHPLCYQGKCHTFLKLRKSEIEVKRDKPVVFISTSYGERATSNDALSRDEYQVIARKADRCPFAEPAVLSDGRDIGKEQWICREATCKDHRGRIPESRSQPASNGSSATTQHQQRRQELFDLKVDEAVRQQVLREAIKTFTWPLSRAHWNDITKEFFRRIPTEHQRTMQAVLGWGQDEVTTFQYDEAALQARIAALSEDELAQFLMLCSFAHYGANRERQHVVDQSAVIALSQTCKVNHALIDATVRMEFCPKKYKDAHQAYLTALQDGKKASKPMVYEAAP